MTSTVLDTILSRKQQEVQYLRRQIPLKSLQEKIVLQPSPINFSGALWGDSVRLIAEVKKASPSRGLLRQDFDPVELATTYANSGAAAISVLTEVDHFQGSLEHLKAVKEATRLHNIPVLRKDFIFDPYQLYEARAHGADAVLLIVAVLTPTQLRELLDVCRLIWLQCLVEIHDEAELQIALDANAEIIGINNRDLKTFKINPSLTEQLRQYIPSGKIAVAESGITSREDVLRYQGMGINAVLVGEALVTASNSGMKVRELLGK
jgi:indole-3-glycerol phosphate synthase